jgi:hypothetical protein
MIADLGEQRVARGVTKAIRNHLEYLPSVAELWEYARNAGDGRNVIHPSPCELCDSTGWVHTTWTTKDGKEVSGVRRCPNWRIQ